MIYGLTMPLARMAKEQGYPEEYPLTTPIKVGDKAEDGSQLRPYIVMFGEYIDGMNVAIDIVSMAYTYKYPRPAVTADCIVITKEAEPKVLLIERGDEPFKGCWAFPGGFMNSPYPLSWTSQAAAPALLACYQRDARKPSGLNWPLTMRRL